MRALHDVATVREAEQRLSATVSDGALMQRAAVGLARRCAELLGSVYGARVVLLVGTGDNGGDTLYAGARLAARGARVDAILVGRAHAAGLEALRRAGGRVGDSSAVAGTAVAGTAAADAVLAGADLVLDGLTGIGATGALREPAASLVRELQGTAATVVSVDLPSGVDADTGAVAGAAVHADVTVTFGARKPGLLLSPGAAYAGLVELVEIGLDLPPAAARVLDADDVTALLPVPDAESSKYLRGVVGVVAGSSTYTGAAVLAAGSAARAGAGMVRFVSTAEPAAAVRARWPEIVVTQIAPGEADAMLGAGRVQAWVIGPGIGTDDQAAGLVEALLGTDLPVLLDADALTICADHHDWLQRRSAPTLLTPHAGEFARLTGADADATEADRLGAARRAAADLGVTVLLKGSTTVVADPDGQARINPTGTSWLATAGSGDVLSGAAGSLLAQGLSALDAGAVGAFLHGLAAHDAAGQPAAPVVAEDLIAHWRAAVRLVQP